MKPRWRPHWLAWLTALPSSALLRHPARLPRGSLLPSASPAVFGTCLRAEGVTSEPVDGATEVKTFLNARRSGLVKLFVRDARVTAVLDGILQACGTSSIGSGGVEEMPVDARPPKEVVGSDQPVPSSALARMFLSALVPPFISP